MYEDFDTFKEYCEDNNDKPSKAAALRHYLEQIESGEIILCDVCKTYTKDIDSHYARYDHDKKICPSCHESGY